MTIKKFNAVQGFSVGETIIYDVIDNAANVSANNLTVSGTTNLGSIANVSITGGSAGYVLKTDGAGGLAWENPADVGVVGSNTQVQFNDNGLFGASANFTFNKSTKTLTVDNITANGAGLTFVPGANVDGTVADANYAAYSGVITIGAQPNITSLGTLTRANITGNLSAGNANLGNLAYAQYLGGTLTTADQPNITSVGTLIDTTLGPLNSLTGGNLVSATYLTGTLTTKAQPNITSVGTLTTLRVTANVTSGNVIGGNLVTATYLSGDGYLISNIDGLQVTGTVANANYAAYAGTVVGHAQPNITSVGTLVDTTMGSSNSLTGGNLVSATYLTGTLTTKIQPNITSVGTLINTTMGSANSLTGGNLVSATYLTGTLTTADQPNITAVGTLVDTTIGAGNSLTGGNLLSANYVTGTLTTKVQPNITSVGTLTSLNVSGNITSGNNVIVTANVSAGNANLGNLVTASYFSGSGNLLSNIQGANVSGEVGSANIAWRVSSAAQPNITSVGTLTNVVMAGPNSLTGGNLLSANYVAGTLTTKDQPNITSVGTLNGLNVTGDTSITGNLTVTGSVEIANVATFKVQDPIIEQGGKTDGTALTTNDHLDRGQLLHYYTTQPVDAFMGWDNSNAEFAFGSNVSVASEQVTFNQFGNVRANFFLGNASQLVGTIANANYAAYAGNVTVAAQPNITSVGTLVDTTLGGSNSLTGGNLLSANYVTGTLTTKTQPNITSVGTLINTTMGSANSLTGGNLVSATYLTGTLTTAAQPNITSVGTLVDTTMGASNSLTGGNLLSANYVTGTLTTAAQPNITSVGTLVNTTMGPSNSLTGGNLVSATYLTGTLTTTSQPNISSVGTLTSLNVSGNITSGNNVIVTANVSAGNANLGNLVTANYFTGSGNLLSNIQGANVTGEVALANIAWRVSSGNQPNITAVGTLVNTVLAGPNSLTGGNLVSANYIAGTLTTQAQPNITSVGTLVDTTMGSSNSLTGGNLVSATYLTGTLTTKTQPNITAVGTLVNTVMAGPNSLTGGNLVSANYITGTLTTAAQPNITSVGTLVNTTMGSANSLTGGNLVSATYLTGTLTSAEQPNITTVGTLAGLAVTGDTTINGNLTVTGSVEIANVSTFKVKDPIIEQGGKTDGTALTSNDGLDRGQLLHYYSGSAKDAFMGWDNSNAEFAFGSNVSVSGEIVTFNEFGNLRANYLFGNASQLVGTIANANYAAYAGNVTIAAQPNITSVGTLVDTTMGSSNSLTGGNLVSATYLTGTLTTAAQPNITSVGTLANLNVTGNISTAANVTASYLFGNASQLIGTIANANYAAYAGNVTIAAQPNITSVGTLVDTTMGSSNSLTGGNLVSATYLTGTLTTNAQPNITSVGTLANLKVTGNISTAANITAQYLIGNASQLTGSIENANYAAYAGNVTIAAQPNITSVGTLVDTTMGSSNSLTGGNLVSATYLTGTLTTRAQPNITSVGTLVNTTMGSANSLTGGNLVSATYLTGTLTTADQPNVTSVGTLVDTTMGASNSLTGGNLLSANYVTGTLTTKAQPNITSVGTLVNTTMGASNSLTGGNLVSANYITGTLTTAEQPNITSVGTLNGLNVTGDTTITGNLTVTGSVETANVTTFKVKDPIIEQGGKTDGTALTSNDGYDRGQILHYYSGSAKDAFMGWDNSNAEFAFGSNVSVSSEQVTFTEFGNVRANYFLGNASQLVGTIANANYAAYAGNVINSAQPNITSVGTLVNTTMGGANSLTGGNLVSANYFTGTLTTAAQPNITAVGTLVNTTLGASNSLTGGNLVSANYFTGTLTTAAQPNITSVGTLVNTTLGASNSLTGGNLVSANYFTGTLTTKVQPNITSIGSLVGLTVSNSSGVVDFTTTANVSLGAIGNLHISGGTSGYVLSTDGSGALSWTNPTTVGVVGSNTQIQFNDNGAFGASANFTFNKSTNLLSVTGNVKRNGLSLMAFSSGSTAPANPVAGDEWYDQLNDVIYKYIFDGTSYYWVDSTSGYLASNVSNVANTMALRDTGGNLTATYFIGDGSLLTGVGSSGGLANGTSNIKAGIVNGNITVGVAGIANTVIFTPSGMNVIATGGINAGNLVTANYFTGTLTTGAQPNITSVGTLQTTTLAANANIAMSGTLSQIAGANLVSASYLTGTLTTGAQPNITSHGSLIGLTVSNATGVVDFTTTANVTLGNVSNLHITGGSSGQILSTNGSGGLSWIAAPTGSAISNGTSNITASVASGNITVGVAGISNTVTFTPSGMNIIATGGINAGNVVTANYFTGTLTTGAQPNITSVGTLQTTTLAANANIAMSGTLSQIAGANLISGTYVAGTLTTGAQPNITSHGSLIGLTVSNASGVVDFTNTANVSLGAVGNVHITGGSSGQILSTNGSGGLSWIAVPTSASIANGTSNITASVASGNITVGVAGISNTVTFTPSGMNIISTGGINAGNVVTANYFTGTLTTGAQPNITSVGTLSSVDVTANANVGNINATNGNLSGNLVVSGNLTVGGSVTYVNVNNLYVKDTIIEQGGGANNAALTTNDGFDRGQLLHYYTTGVVDAFMGWDNSNAEFAFGSNVSVAANVVTFNNFGNVRANHFLGNASQLTGTIANANYAAYAGNVINATQSNITSVGTLTSLAVTANANVGNLNSSGRVYANDNIIIGSTGSEGGQLVMGWVGINGMNGQANGTWNMDVDGSNNFRLFSQNATGVSKVNMTAYSANNDVGFSGNISSVGNVTAAYLKGDGGFLSNIQVTAGTSIINGTSNVAVGASANVTVGIGGTSNVVVISPALMNVAGTVKADIFESTNNANGTNFKIGDDTWIGDINTADTLSVRGQQNAANGWIVFGNADTTAKFGRAGTGPLSYTGAMAISANITTPQLISNVATGTAPFIVTSTTQVANLNVAQAGIAGTVTTNAQPNITSTGTLASLNVTGNISSAANVTAQYLFGNGSQLTGTIANANYAAYAGNVINAAQSNITSLGTLTNVVMAGPNSFTGGNLVSANYITGTLTTAAQPNITSVGTLVNTVMAGPNSFTGGNLVSANYITGTLTTGAQSNITSVGTLTDLNVTGNISTAANVTASYLFGNASQLTGLPSTYTNTNVSSYLATFTGLISAGNISASGNITSANATVTGTLTAGSGTGGTISGANLVSANYFTGTLTTGAQPNITAVGTLTSANVTGNVTAAYFIGDGSQLTGIVAGTNYTNTNVSSYLGTFTGLVAAGNVTATGNVTASYFIGNASQLTGTIANANYAAYSGVVTANAQPNITSVGTLTNVVMAGPNSFTGGNLVSANYITGTLTTGAQSNITSVGTLTSLNVTGNISTAANVTASYLFGNASQLTGLPATYTNTNVSSYLGTFTGLVAAGNVTATGNVTASYLIGNGSQITGTIANANYAAYAGNVINAAQSNITSVGTLTSITTSGDGSIGGNLTVTGNLTVSGTTTTVNSTTVNINDINIVLANNATTAAQANGAGITINGAAANMIYNSTSNAFVFSHVISADGGLLSNIAGANVTGTVANATYATSAGSATTATSATTAGTVTANAQPNITSVGDLANLHVAGNLTVDGKIIAPNIAGTSDNVTITAGTFVSKFDTTGNITLSNNVSVVANLSTGNLLTDNILYANGTPWTFTNYANSNVASYLPTYTGLVAAGNVTATGNVTAGYFIGNGAMLTGLPATYANSNVAAYLPTYTGNITGNIVTLTGNVSAINANLGNLVTANYFSGSGNLLSNIQGANVSGTVANATYATSAGSATTATSATTAGTVTANAQPNITSVGTLTSLTVSGTSTLGSASNVKITGGAAGYVLTTDGTGNLSWSAAGSGSGASSFVAISKDKFVATGSESTYILSTTPVGKNAIEVVIDGLQQISDTYTLTGSVVGFASNPVAGQVIEVTVFGVAALSGSAGEIQYNAGGAIGSASTFTYDSGSDLLTVGNVQTGSLTSKRANIAVTTNTVIDEFPTTSYRSAKYYVSAKGTDGYQSAEALIVQDGTSSFVTIYASICSNASADIVEFSSNIVGGNVKLYATTGSASTTVNLIPIYITD